MTLNTLGALEELKNIPLVILVAINSVWITMKETKKKNSPINGIVN